MLGPGFGLGRYVQQLVHQLIKIDSENEYVLFLKSDNYNEVKTENGNFKKVLANIDWYTWEEQLKFKKIIRKEKLDLMHFPHFNVPLLYNDAFVVTIHDLTMFHYPRPEASTRSRIIFWIKDKAHRLVIRHAVGKARHIMATSEFTKQDIADTLHVPKEKITVTYQAPFVEREGWKAESGHPLEKFGINKPYILYVGAAYPHKNLDKLLEAWKIFETKYSTSYQLVLVGKEDYFYKRLKSTANSQQSTIIFTDFVPDDELVELYENAHLYVFPSLYEGFGLPPLEAMSRGTPVVASSASCLPEVLGEAAMYFDPTSENNMVEVIYKVLNDTNIQMQLHQSARENLQRFSWKNLAENTIEIYREAGK